MIFSRNPSFAKWPLALLFAGLMGLPLFGTDTPAIKDSTTASVDTAKTTPPAADQSPLPVGSMIVIEAYPAQKSKLVTAGYHASLDEEIIVVARNFPAWLKKLTDEGELAVKKNPDGTTHTLSEDEVKGYGEQVCLFLNEKPFPDLIAERADKSETFENSKKYVGKSQGDYYLFRFKLVKTAENTGAWLDLLRGQGIRDRLTDVTVGFYNLDGRTSHPHMDSALNPIGTEAKASPHELFSIRTAVTWKLCWGIAGVTAITLLCGLLGHYTSLLRDTTSALKPTGRYPFSLGMCQMAFWTLIISASFIFLAIVIGDYETVSPAAVTLMGIASATGLGAVLINQAEKQTGQDKLKNVTRSKTKKAVIKSLVAAGNDLKAVDNSIMQIQQTLATAGPNADLQSTLDKLNAQKLDLQSSIADLKASLPSFGFWPAVKSFAMDLLQESDSVSFHRFQLLVWTCILGVVFVYNVFEELAMPDFSASLLILVGISSGTYIGFKFPAAKPPMP